MIDQTQELEKTKGRKMTMITCVTIRSLCYDPIVEKFVIGFAQVVRSSIIYGSECELNLSKKMTYSP